ncbi:MAG TPA: hypothetical protein PLN94_01680 [Thiolinea sp.]|nr:hypothetical protein [Thiolinea sp.]
MNATKEMNETNAGGTSLQAVYYWPDGYWITSREDAELLDEFNAFGGQRTELRLPAGADVQAEVNARISREGDKHAH